MHEVVVGALVRDGRVLLGHRRSDKRAYPDVWDLPGGVVEAGESELDALARELGEELGVQIATDSASHLCRLTAGPPDEPAMLSAWVVRDWQGTPANVAPEEHDDIGWFSVEELPPPGHPLLREALVDAMRGDWTAGSSDSEADGAVTTMRPTLFLTVGLPGTGKTTAARRIEAEENALRLTKDEWMKALYGPANPPSASDVIEGRLIDIGLRALQLGVNVVIDYGLWGRDERSALRAAAAEVGAGVQMHYFELTPAEQRRRLDRRQAEEPPTTWHMSDEQLATWAATISVPTAGELDGSEPVDDPPAGFATWEQWRRHRWPPSVG